MVKNTSNMKQNNKIRAAQRMKPSTGDFVWKVWPYGKCSTRSMRRRFALVFFERCCPTFSSFPAIGHFWVTKTLTFKTRLSSKPFLCIWILFAWEYHRKSSYKKSFKFIMPMVFLLVAYILKHFKRGRGVCMYTTQVNNAFRARWLASSVIGQVLFLAFKWRHKNPYSKIARTCKVLSPSSKISLKNTLPRKFSTWYRFPFWKYSSF